MQPRVVENMPAQEYFEAGALGSTSIKTLGDPELSMAEVRHELQKDEYKPEYDQGTLGHALILEGSLDQLIKRIEGVDDYRTKAAREARDEARAEGLIPVNDTEAKTMLEPLVRMREAVMAHPIAGRLLTGHKPEVSYFWEQDGVPCKARVDAVHSGLFFVDLKLLRSARPNDVGKQISDLGYYVQAQHYLNGAEAVTGFRPDWLFVVVSKSEPYSVSVHRLHPDSISAGQARIDYGLRRYQQAIAEDHWPGYETIYEQELPVWEKKKIEELLEVSL